MPSDNYEGGGIVPEDSLTGSSIRSNSIPEGDLSQAVQEKLNNADSKSHDQNTDTKLDEGGSNEVAASQIDAGLVKLSRKKIGADGAMTGVTFSGATGGVLYPPVDIFTGLSSVNGGWAMLIETSPGFQSYPIPDNFIASFSMIYYNNPSAGYIRIEPAGVNPGATYDIFWWAHGVA